jgi:hypothetical protein
MDYVPGAILVSVLLYENYTHHVVMMAAMINLVSTEGHHIVTRCQYV